MAASVAFLIARYFARERILKLVEDNKKFLAIDKAIGENGFRVVTLLRLSPLLPFSLGNYLYGLTSVKFVPYVLGRFVPLQLFILFPHLIHCRRLMLVLWLLKNPICSTTIHLFTLNQELIHLDKVTSEFT